MYTTIHTFLNFRLSLFSISLVSPAPTVTPPLSVLQTFLPIFPKKIPEESIKNCGFSQIFRPFLPKNWKNFYVDVSLNSTIAGIGSITKGEACACIFFPFYITSMCFLIFVRSDTIAYARIVDSRCDDVLAITCP